MSESSALEFETYEMDRSLVDDVDSDRSDQILPVPPLVEEQEESAPDTREVPTQAAESSTLSETKGRVLSFQPRGPRWQKEHIEVLRSWQGVVESVQEDTFIARLIDRDGMEPDIEAEIYLDEVFEQDRPLVRAGAVFYWSIGYRDIPTGRTRFSSLKFRRLPVWQARDIEQARAHATELENLGW